MRLNFLLHTYQRDQPGGGLKVEYEFANRLAARGHDVVVYHDLNFDRGFLRHPRSVAGALRANLAGPGAVEWFPLAVRCRYVPTFSPRLLRAADATIVDSFLVTERVTPSARTGPFVHVVYEYPVWQTGEEGLRARLVASLHRPGVARVATSTAVEDMLAQCGASAVAKITCGIDLPDLSAVPPTTERAPIVGFALRREPHKRLVDVLEALPCIREAYPTVRFEAFGAAPVGGLSPDVYQHGYLDDRALAAFYQRVSVFVSPSAAEGWGLTVAEAMAHGAAVVVAENGGAADFAFHGETALLVPAAAPEALAGAAISLLRDVGLRTRIVAGGLGRTRAMSWEDSVSALESLLTRLARPRRSSASCAAVSV